jgi:hypothetical protein
LKQRIQINTRVPDLRIKTIKKVRMVTTSKDSNSMPVKTLFPSLDLLRQEYVLVQAWKKTASHIRNHNWYSDTLALDRAALDLPYFLGEVKELLERPDQWRGDPLRLVPAPKSQAWHINPKTNKWEPEPDPDNPGKKIPKAKLRPLAHVSLKDQVVSTAIMLCLADRVETCQGDPRASIKNGARLNVVSYGNRLFCDQAGGGLRHRWGSGKLYRSYYQDYQSFLARPDVIAESIDTGHGVRTVVVHSDLAKFYDTVSPALLAEKLGAVRVEGDDGGFFALCRRVLDWRWHGGDAAEIKKYEKQAGLSNFRHVALPQGLVAAGFFANVVLLDFDNALRLARGGEIMEGISLVDACRYVDDLRLVLRVEVPIELSDIEKLIANWLSGLLDKNARGLIVSQEKTNASVYGGNERPVLQQSRKMARIQNAISGGFDAAGGEDIIDAVQGLVQSQRRYSENLVRNDGLGLAPVPDVGDATVARFSAARFRSTYRSLRPLLQDRAGAPRTAAEDMAVKGRCLRTKAELDEEARAFALGLIDRWLYDPSNVRLLRIGLDIWPDKDVLKKVLDLLMEHTLVKRRRSGTRRVAWYCLSEVFRAAVTETGFVGDDESLPAGVDIDEYRHALKRTAVKLASCPRNAGLPWYLMQQVYLFLSADRTEDVRVDLRRGSRDTRHHREMVQFLSAAKYPDPANSRDCALLTIQARRCFGQTQAALRKLIKGASPEIVREIALRDPSLAVDIVSKRRGLVRRLPVAIRKDLCLSHEKKTDNWMTLAQVVLQGGVAGILRNELSLLFFAIKFLDEYEKKRQELSQGAITPADVSIRLADGKNVFDGDAQLDIDVFVSSPGDSMYVPPSWCQAGDRWRYQLGCLLRFILAARPDFTRAVRPPSWKEDVKTYRPPESHWLQRLYGHYNGQSAFGDDWLPISDWAEFVLAGLLAWPGYRKAGILQLALKTTASAGHVIMGRIDELQKIKGKASGVLMLPLSPSRPDGSRKVRPLRACIVQSVIPMAEDYSEARRKGDLTLSSTDMRRRHRNHLSTALAAVERMLALRETHKGLDGRLDWLILPELSVHPEDVRTHLIPFARNHKTIILAGITYQEVLAGSPLMNSALWIIPTWSKANGLQIVVRRQGKEHLAACEKEFNIKGEVVRGFRPCQWLIGYQWRRNEDAHPLWLTASICYDATDLGLASDLRNLSDVFAIPAVNMDVSTYDHMALALHYHMFQMVIVANTGEYGGSNAYAPYKDAFVKQVFHLHGQPQASIGFLEIADIGKYLQRKTEAKIKSDVIETGRSKEEKWKHPPAGI